MKSKLLYLAMLAVLLAFAVVSCDNGTSPTTTPTGTMRKMW